MPATSPQFRTILLLFASGCLNENNLISSRPQPVGASALETPVAAPPDAQGVPPEGEVDTASMATIDSSTPPCVEDQQSFDTTSVSVLESAIVLSNVHDAVIIENPDAAAMEAAGSWRVASVDVMPLIPENSFNQWPDGQQLAVEVWDADNPSAPPWTLTQSLHLADLSWSTVTLPNGEVEKSAWWNFSFDSIIPTSGMQSARYLAGIHWVGTATPPLGYSNYDLDCSLNWTDSGGGWVLNSNTHTYTCNYPMMRINLEVTVDGDCEERGG